MSATVRVFAYLLLLPVAWMLSQAFDALAPTPEPACRYAVIDVDVRDVDSGMAGACPNPSYPYAVERNGDVLTIECVCP